MVVLALASVWWLTGRIEEPAGQALYQFNTQDYHSLAFDPVDVNTVYFGHHDGLKVSHDAGASWQDAALSGVDAMQLVMPSNASERRYAAGHDVFYISTDGGESWREQMNDLPGLDLHAFAGSPTDPNRLYTAPMGNGLWTSADGGTAWNETTMPPGAETQPIALAVSPSDPEIVYLARNGEIAISTDRGMTWQSEPGPGGMIITLAVANDSDETLFVGTMQGLYRQEGSWSRLALEPDGAVVAVALSADEPARVAVIDARGNVYRSDDAGDTWQTR
jgi:photosystem II stability/assembly factor-like uncharacterized protein